MYHHLMSEERERIARLVDGGFTQTRIAKRLKRNKGTISRELKRNSTRSGYWPVAAQRKAEGRRRRSRHCKLAAAEMQQYVVERLQQYWSPDQIAGRSRREFPRNLRRQLSSEAIYRWLQVYPGNRYRRYLRREGWRRKRPENPGRLPGAVTIRGRPTVVDRRHRLGDWEGDTLVGARGHGGAVSLVERKSRYVLLEKIVNRRAETVRQSMIRLYEPLPADLRKTLTLDNGKEFARHREVAAATGLRVFFADTYCAWQRGTNENMNGLVRQFFPKDTDMTCVSDASVARVQKLLNDWPRKCLNYRTPREVLTKNHRVALQM